MLWFCVTYTMAQTNYYAVTKTFKENGYTYQCDVSNDFFIMLCESVVGL